MRYIDAGSIEAIRNNINLVEKENPALIQREINAERKGQNRATVINMLESFKKRNLKT